MRTLYFECFSGISGDMTIGALLDLGADKKVLLEAIESLNIEGYDISISTVQKCGITATKFDVLLEGETHDHHDHDHHEHTHSHDNEPYDHQHHHHDDHDLGFEFDNHNHDHAHDHAHDHDHTHDHDHHHRGLKEIREIILNSSITENAKKIALDTFEVLAEAEAKVHGVSKDEVHFHEVGAIDSIIDIVGIAVCIDNLNIDKFACSKIYEGQGHVFCQHGLVPIPAPATLELCIKHGLELNIIDVKGELVTPTGAAFLSALKPEFTGFPSGNMLKVGVGAGTKDFKHANILRVYLIEEALDETKDEVILFETNIDDSNGEHLGYAIEKLIEKGALDVYYTPIFMKKNRPSYTLSVLCEKSNESNIIKTIFEHTTAIGLKRQLIERVKMSRKFETIGTIYGDVVLKHCTYEDVVKTYLEYESVKKCAVAHNVGLSEVEKTVKILRG